MPQPLISACLIVRNEDAGLAGCLDALRPLVDEIIVHDTGSTDGTVDIARSFGAAVSRAPWRDDFAWHRNQTLEAATGKWCLVVDADERLVPADFDETRAQLASNLLPDVAMVTMRLRYADRADGTPRANVEFVSPRLVKRSSRIRFHHRIHEQLNVQNQDAILSNLVLDHLGYAEPGALARKETRNLRIARLMPSSPHKHHCIARSAFSLGDWESVIAAARQLVESPGPTAARRDGAALGAAASINAKREADLSSFVAAGLAIDGAHPDTQLAAVVAHLGPYLRMLDDPRATQQQLLRPPVFSHRRAAAAAALELLLGLQPGGIAGTAEEADRTYDNPQGSILTRTTILDRPEEEV